MLAFVYLFVMFALGDSLGRRYFPFVSLAHRLASAFLCGLLISSWWTYMIGLFFASSPTPMFWANLFFFITAGGLIYWLNGNPPENEPNTLLDLSDSTFVRTDWIVAGIFLLFVSWMMLRTFTTGDGNIKFGHHQFPDFGATVSIMQSFATGHNFPTQYPHFSGERIRYHFLFYFQAGNLEYLGINPTLANNILSIFSLSSLLVLVMTFGSLVFRSRLVGRIGAALFFFHGSLSFIPFLMSQPSFGAFIDNLFSMKLFLNSGMPYRGEAWGVWSQNVFLNQRHLSSAIGIFFLVLIYLAIRYRENAEIVTDTEAAVAETPAVAELETPADTEADVTEAETDENGEQDADDESEGPDLVEIIKAHSPYVFCGLLLGLLPMWNGAVFVGAGLILAMLLILFPLRKQLVAAAITAAIFALPQVIYLKTGNLREAGYSMFHWGFVIDNAGVFDVLYWTFFTFGFKWVLLAIGLYFASGLQRRFMAAACILLPLTYCFRFSEEVLANHKFINVWLIVVNVFVAFALVKLWNLKTGSSVLPTRVTAVILTLLITVGGAIDLMPIVNSYWLKDYWIDMKYDDDKLIEWVKTNTDPKSIFLTHRYINHPILLAGRRLFFGDPYYAWGADYDTTAREALVKTMFESRDAGEVYRLLKENNISYVAIDDQTRKGDQYIKNPNEADVYAKSFEVVFTDDSNQYNNIKIYKVPDSFNAPAVNAPPTAASDAPPTAGTNAFSSVEGRMPGQFSRPRGIAVDGKGFFYVADTGNSRIQKFKADGDFVTAFGTAGAGAGELGEPNGIAVDATGNIFVTDAKYHKLLKFQPDGKFVKEWKGPETDVFYGPRDIIFGPNKLLYIIDQGGCRIDKFDPATEVFTTWGKSGAGEGEFNEPTGLAFGANTLFVADLGNNRIQMFDLDGKFIRQWEVQGWERFMMQFPDIVYDDATKHLLISNGKTNEILGFEIEGKPVQGVKPEGDATLDLPGSMVIMESGKQRKLLVINVAKSNIAAIDLGAKPGK